MALLNAIPLASGTPSASTKPSGFYRPELDGLRFFCFLAVFFGHSHLVSSASFADAGPIMAAIGSWCITIISHSGYAAVTVFFVLSSYLITELLLREHERNGRVDLFAFYARRALRIWPLYFLFLGVVLWLEPRLGVTGLSPHAVPWFAGFLANWQIVLTGEIPRSAAQVLWTVSIEEQFYLLWPLLLVFMSPKRLPWICLGLMGVGHATRWWLVGHHAPTHAIHFHTAVQLDAIAWGGLLALALRHSRLESWSPIIRTGMAASGVVLAIGTQRFLAEAQPHAAWPLLAYPLFAFAAVLIVFGVMRTNPAQGGLLTHPRIVYLGKISYGLYIWHLLAIVLAYKSGLCSPRSVWTSVIALPLTMIFAHLSYRFFEAPFLRWKGSFQRVYAQKSEALSTAAEAA
jgi:peptidoglycan/LPS O-acetylase OafA/YrhL